MFQFEKRDSILFITLSGKVTADEVTAFYDRFNATIEEIDIVGLVIDMTGFDDMTAEAIARDIPMELALLDQMGKFPKVAIVSDKEFVAALTRAFNPLVPMIEMRSFAPAEIDAAIAFASDLPPKPRKGKGARLLESSDDSVLAFEIDGYIDDDEMQQIADEVTTRLKRGDRFNVLGRIRSFGGFDPSILTERSFFRMKFGAIKAMKRYAIVSDENWLKPLVGLAGMVTGIETRLFPLSEEAAAWEWVRG